MADEKIRPAGPFGLTAVREQHAWRVGFQPAWRHFGSALKLGKS